MFSLLLTGGFAEPVRFGARFAEMGFMTDGFGCCGAGIGYGADFAGIGFGTDVSDIGFGTEAADIGHLAAQFTVVELAGDLGISYLRGLVAFHLANDIANLDFGVKIFKSSLIL